jgi:hypothetical protein
VTGSTAEAVPLLTRAEESYPEATFVRTVLGPVTRAAAALYRHRGDEAISALEASVPTELGTVAGLVPLHLRAEAFLQRESFAEALKEYQKILDHRGVDPFAPMVALAHLGIARAHARSGNDAASRRAYEELFTIWKTADADLAPAAAARAEYARLAKTSTAP